METKAKPKQCVKLSKISEQQDDLPAESKAVFKFLKAARGNWRNAVFIECGNCILGHDELCAGFLLAFDAAAKPIIIRVEQLVTAFGEVPDIDECTALIDRADFEQLFAAWLKWAVDSPYDCTLLKVSEPS